MSETHFAFYIPDEIKSEERTLKQWSKRVGTQRFHKSSITLLLDKEYYADRVCRTGWHLIMKEGIPNSENNRLGDSGRPNGFLEGYDLPNLVTVVVMHLLYHAKISHYLNAGRFLACQERVGYELVHGIGFDGPEGIQTTYVNTNPAESFLSRSRRSTYREVRNGAERYLPPITKEESSARIPH